MSTELGELRFVKVADILVDPEQNPRGEITKDDIAELVASIREDGLGTPVQCAEGPAGLELVAGYRRVAACKEAALEEIPVYVRDAAARDTHALIENLPGLRRDMAPIAEARAMKRIASASNLNQRDLAKRLGKSPSFVAERMRMLRLPESVQDVFACGRPGISVVAELEKIAKVSEPAAVRIAQLAGAEEGAERLLRTNPERLMARFAQVLASDRATTTSEEGVEAARAPAEGDLAVFAIGAYGGIDIAELAIAEERRAQLAERLASLYGEEEAATHSLEIPLGDDDVDALRALGVLLEYEDEDRHYSYASRYCFDSDAILDRLEGVLSEEERATATAREAEEKEARKAAAKAAGGEFDEGTDPQALLAEKAEELRQEKLAEEREAKAKARRLNLDLGLRLLKRRARKRTEKRRRELIRALALLAVAAEKNLGGLGPRLTYEAWREVERKRLKSGKLGAEKVTYMDVEDARKRLRGEILSAKGIDDILDVIGDALVGAVYCSEEEMPMSRRVSGYYGRLSAAERGPIRKAIDEEAKGVLAPELVEELKRSRERGYEETDYAR